MDRRSFLSKAACGSAAVAATGAIVTPAIAQNRRVLTMVTSWPRGLAGVWDSVERFATNVADITDGTLIVDAKGAGEIVGAFEVFDAVASGQADMYHAADYYFGSQNPGFYFYTAVPFGMTAPEFTTWYYAQGGMKLHHELSEYFNLRNYVAGQTAAQGGGWFRKPINHVDDWAGLKFRMPGLGGQVLSRLGASVQVLPGGEIYQALATGAIEGTEWIGPWADEKLGLQEVCNYYYPAGFHEPGAALSVSINLDVFNSLPRNHQRAIEISAAEAYQHNYALFIANNGPALRRLIASGINIETFSNDIWDAYGANSIATLESYRGDPIYDKIYDSMRAGMISSSKWASLSDSFYTTQRNRVLDAL